MIIQRAKGPSAQKTKTPMTDNTQGRKLTEGIINKYQITRTDGKELHPNFEAFVLRLDENGSDKNHLRACKIAVNAYAEAIKDHLPVLAEDIKNKYPYAEQEKKEQESKPGRSAEEVLKLKLDVDDFDHWKMIHSFSFESILLAMEEYRNQPQEKPSNTVRFIIDGKHLSKEYTIIDLLNHSEESILEDMEKPCSNGCVNESTMHCECDPEFADSSITGFQFQPQEKRESF